MIDCLREQKRTLGKCGKLNERMMDWKKIKKKKKKEWEFEGKEITVGKKRIERKKRKEMKEGGGGGNEKNSRRMN